MPWQVSAKPVHAHQLGSTPVPAHDMFHFRRPLRQHRVTRTHRAATCMAADAQHIMVNACTGKMGHATAEAVVRAGLTLVPYSFTGSSEAVAVGNVGVEGIPVELVGPEERQQAMEQAKREYPDMIIIDFTLPQAVNGNDQIYCEVQLKAGSVSSQHFSKVPPLMQTMQSFTARTRFLLSWELLEGIGISFLKIQKFQVSMLSLPRRWESRCDLIHYTISSLPYHIPNASRMTA